MSAGAHCLSSPTTITRGASHSRNRLVMSAWLASSTMTTSKLPGTGGIDASTCCSGITHAGTAPCAGTDAGDVLAVRLQRPHLICRQVFEAVAPGGGRREPRRQVREIRVDGVEFGFQFLLTTGTVLLGDPL